MRKVIFLDLDGVLNTARWHRQADQQSLQDEYGYRFDPAAVANLKKIVDDTGAEIVISSSWKYMGLTKLKKMWKERMLPGKLIDVTPNSVGDKFLLHADLDSMDLLSIRGKEIKEWLMLHGRDVSHYAILDDMNDIQQEQEPYFVWIDPEVGITNGNVMQVVMILNHVPNEKIIQ